uniref:Phospholipid phosphatase related 5 n=1 Tax=Amazona collaria TaxID=241587 RepID=A0A8B9FHR8_9PSIT
ARSCWLCLPVRVLCLHFLPELIFCFQKNRKGPHLFSSGIYYDKSYNMLPWRKIATKCNSLFPSLGIYAFGLFATDIFVNAGQVVTGNLAPHFLALCKPNYTALGCKQYTQFISSVHACTGNPDLIMKARKTFPSKEAALSVYAAMYLAVIKARGTRLAKPVLCLGLMCMAFLTGINRVAEYRNHWSDVIAGFVIGISIAVFLVSVYLCHFCVKTISVQLYCSISIKLRFKKLQILQRNLSL